MGQRGDGYEWLIRLGMRLSVYAGGGRVEFLHDGRRVVYYPETETWCCDGEDGRYKVRGSGRAMMCRALHINGEVMA